MTSTPPKPTAARATRKAQGDERLERLTRVCARVDSSGVRALSVEEVAALPRLYRYAATRLAHLETSGRDPDAARSLRAVLARAHGILFHRVERDERNVFVRSADFLLREVPRTIRAEWRPLALSFALLYGLALVSFFAVSADLDLAWSLLDPASVAMEIQQLQGTPEGQPFRGNFIFGLEDSPTFAGLIMAHNMSVGVLFFAAGLVPPLFAYAVATNGLMLGTYTAVAAHWGRGTEISSILWCHGVIELQAIVLAGASGLVLVRGLLFSGPWTRAHALRLGARRAWRLLAPVFPLLFLAGLIEGFVSPHAPTGVRMMVAVVSGVALLAWALLGGRTVDRRPSQPS